MQCSGRPGTEVCAIADQQPPQDPSGSSWQTGSAWDDELGSDLPGWARALFVVAVVLVIAVGVYFVWWLVAGRPF